MRALLGLALLLALAPAIPAHGGEHGNRLHNSGFEDGGAHPSDVYYWSFQHAACLVPSPVLAARTPAAAHEGRFALSTVAGACNVVASQIADGPYPSGSTVVASAMVRGTGTATIRISIGPQAMTATTQATEVWTPLQVTFSPGFDSLGVAQLITHAGSGHVAYDAVSVRVT